IQNKSRGAWHQSAVGQVRYDSLATCGDNPQGEVTGSGDAPAVLAAENDLIWAEALIRQGTPDLVTAATLINHTRVGPDLLGRRGGRSTPDWARAAANLGARSYRRRQQARRSSARLFILVASLALGSGCRGAAPPGSWREEAGYRWRELRVARSGGPGFAELSPSQTGIHFTNAITLDSALWNRHL